MAKYRDYYLAKNSSVGDSGSFTWNLPTGIKIQDIRVVYTSTNGATSNTVGKLCGMITKLEVLNGSDVLASLSGREAQALFAFNGKLDYGKLPMKVLNAGAGLKVTEEFPIIFGRYFRDPLYYLDTSKYQNPQIRLTHAMTISATAGFATGTTTVSIVLRIIDSGAPAYAGFLMNKEIQSWTTAASGDNATYLPLDYPYAAIMVQGLYTANTGPAVLTNFKLLVNLVQFIPYDMESSVAAAMNFEQFGEFKEYFVPLSDTTFTWLSDLYYNTGAVMDIAGATGKGNISSVTAESIVGTFTTGQGAGTMRVRAEGLCPHASFWLPFGDGDTPGDYLDPTQGINDLRLLTTQGVGSGDGRVVISQLRQ
jgi:hypothetical protein